MSIQTCPVSGYRGNRTCPAGQTRFGPRGCAFSGFEQNWRSSSVYSDVGRRIQAVEHANVRQDMNDTNILYEKERRALNEILTPEAPAREMIKNPEFAHKLQRDDDDLLAFALGAPARRVLTQAEEIGPRTGWKDGYLSSAYGFLPPDPSDSPVALRESPGFIWSDLCERMPGLVARGSVRNSILKLPLVLGTLDIIPDRALWAATTCLGILASVYRYEEANDGDEGIDVMPSRGTFKNIHGGDDEEIETKGIPRNVVIPLRQVCSRMGRALPHLSQFDVSVYNYKLRDPTSVLPYVTRTENMDLRWPVFGDRAEAMFLLCMAEVHGCFQTGVETITRCQEAVMGRDPETLLRELTRLKELCDQLPHIIHKISVNPKAGEQFTNPIEWGQKYAKFSAPLSKRVPALSGLALPFFLLMDVFIGRTRYDSFLGVEAVQLRRWLPLNIRAFITAIENHYQVPEFVKASGDPRLVGVLEGIVESYAGERGFMGTHRYKVYGFLEVVAKTSHTETDGISRSDDSEGRAWEEVHRMLSDSMKERLDPYHGDVKDQPHQMRGSFAECRFQARIMQRRTIDLDPHRVTGMVTFDIQNSGITFQPGDRLAVMPMNPSYEIAKVAVALGLDEMWDVLVPVEHGSIWARFSKHLENVSKLPSVGLTVKDILKRGHLAPLTKDLVSSIHQLFQNTSQTIQKILTSNEWPVKGSVGDLLQTAIAEVSEHIWDGAFDLTNLAWLPKLITPEVPRTYSISNSSSELLPSFIDLTVYRTESTRDPIFEGIKPDLPLYGVSSGFLNPNPERFDPYDTTDDQEVLIGVSRPVQFQLPPSPRVPLAMFAGGSGIAPFRSFLQKRIETSVGRNILFLGVQSREKFLHEDALQRLVRSGSLELHTAFSRDRRGLVYNPAMRELEEQDMDPRYIDSAIIEEGRLVSELVMSRGQGGLGGYLYICGSVSVYETVMVGIKQAIRKYQASIHSSADLLLATAFAERRFMLDIFMSPQAVLTSSSTITISQLAAHTGHRKESRMWIGVKSGVYDVTDFLSMHPGGSLIVAANAGLDATKTFCELAHDNNPEVSSLLSKYFVGHLTVKPDFQSTRTSDLYDMWYHYLRISVESLTSLSLEANNILEDSKAWFSGSLMNISGVRKFHRLQSRLMQNGFSTLFGARLQEVYLKLSFTIANTAPTVRLPDIIGTFAKAQSSRHATKAMQEVSRIVQLVSSSSKSTRSHESGVLQLVQTVMELNISFLEHIRDEIAQGMDAFEMIPSMDESSSSKQIKIASYLLSILERIAAHLETYYDSVVQEFIHRHGAENSPARTRWSNVRRRIFDGSFFILTRPSSMSTKDDMSGMRSRPGPNSVEVDFAQIFTSAQQTIQNNPTIGIISPQDEKEGPKRLADMHTARAANSTQAPSTFDMQQQGNAVRRISTFVTDNMPILRRLSHLSTEYDFPDLTTTYEEPTRQKQPRVSPSHSKIPSSTSNTNTSSQHLRNQSSTYDRSISPLPAPTPVRTTSHTPSLETSVHPSYRQPKLLLPRRDRLSPAPSTSSEPPTALADSEHSAVFNAAVVQFTRRQPPRSITPLPSSPRASLALMKKKTGVDVSTSPVPVIPVARVGSNGTTIVAELSADEVKVPEERFRL